MKCFMCGEVKQHKISFQYAIKLTFYCFEFLMHVEELDEESSYVYTENQLMWWMCTIELPRNWIAVMDKLHVHILLTRLWISINIEEFTFLELTLRLTTNFWISCCSISSVTFLLFKIFRCSLSLWVQSIFQSTQSDLRCQLTAGDISNFSL